MEKKKGFFQEMASFSKDGRVKSSFFVYAVCVSFLCAAVHVIVLGLLLEPLHNYFSDGLADGWLNLLENGIPALIAAALCNLPFFVFRDKRLILAAYILILLYIAIIAVAALVNFEADAGAAFMAFLWTVIPAHLICGLVVSGGVYIFHRSRVRRK